MFAPSFTGNTQTLVEKIAGTVGAGAAGMASQVGVAATAAAAWTAIVAAAPYVLTGGAIAGVAYGVKKLLEDDDTNKEE